MTIQEKFEEVKDHPLVILLLQYYAKRTRNPIPPVWQEFIRTSTESTSLDLMYTQLKKWALTPQDIPPGMFGQALLNHLTWIKFQPLLLSVQSTMSQLNLGIIPALERVFRSMRVIPRDVSSNNVESKYRIRANLQYCYTERGTLKYQITRSIPMRVLIPPAFIRANFGPNHSDTRVWNSFMTGLETRFKSSAETQAVNNSLPWVFGLIDRSEECLNTRTGTRGISSSAFPVKVPLRCTQDEMSATLSLSNPVPDPVDPATVVFRLPADSRGYENRMILEFPVLSTKDVTELQDSGEDLSTVPPPEGIFNATLQEVVSNPGSAGSAELKAHFIAALRCAHNRITESETFQAQRRIAVDLAAGL